MISAFVKYCNKTLLNPKVYTGICRFNRYKGTKGIKLMGLNVTQNFRTGIDTSILKEVSAEFLKRAQAKAMNAQTGSVRTAFKAADLGLDLYQGRVDSATARQVAMNNSGMQIQLNQNVLDSIKFLNSQAAQNVQKNVEGKIAFSVYEGADVQKAAEAPKFNSIVSFSTAKDKKGSNPFYHGELLANGHKKEEKREDINIFG